MSRFDVRWVLVALAMMAGPRVLAGGIDPEADRLRVAGWEASYRTDYEAARVAFSELQRRLPEHPIGDLSMASIVWQEYLFRTRRLQSNFYQKNSNFYAGASQTKEGREGGAFDAQVDARFQELLGSAMAKAQRMVDREPGNVEAIYFLGAVYGVRASYEATAQKRFWAAIRDGLRSVKLHQKVLDLQPDYYDAYLTVGTYHYVVGAVPLAFRLIANMAGIWGGKKKGIAELELALHKGTFNREDARTVLIAIYRNENTPGRALAELEGFVARYPGNALLRMERALTLAQMGRGSEAEAEFEALRRAPDPRLADLIEYQYGEALVLGKQYGRAAARFAAVQSVAGAESGLVTQSLLRAGQMYDLAGERESAKGCYRAFLVRSDNRELRKSAERWLRAGYSGD